MLDCCNTVQVWKKANPLCYRFVVRCKDPMLSVARNISSNVLASLLAAYNITEPKLSSFVPDSPVEAKRVDQAMRQWASSSALLLIMDWCVCVVLCALMCCVCVVDRVQELQSHRKMT